jgi:lysylphosphatidylglycerol synthetase-like protein (DUF2156 family)
MEILKLTLTLLFIVFISLFVGRTEINVKTDQTKMTIERPMLFLMSLVIMVFVVFGIK